LVRAAVVDLAAVVLDFAAVVLVVDLAAAVVLVLAAAVVGVVAAPAAEAEAEAVETAWRAMPSPRALAIPMLRDATSARLRAAGWGRFVLMGVNLRSRREPLVRVR
jgi:hypothetical protein